jgi:uncharacterized protein
VQETSDGSRWMLRLDDGEDVFAQITEFARRHTVRAAAIVSGIGMFKAATFGYWDGKEYRPHSLDLAHELVALHGSIAEVDGAPSVHLHVGLAGPDHRLVGGHLLRATVGILNEICIETFPGQHFGRPLDESFGLRRLDLLPERGA